MLLFLSVCIALLYLPFLGNAFVSDDIGGIVTQAHTWVFPKLLGWSTYIHLNILFHYGIYHVFGLVPWAFRLLNILFHVGSTMLVFAIGKKLAHQRIGAIAAICFAIHPLATESVVWIAGGVYAQHTFFLLLSFWLYMKKTTGAYWWSVGVFIVCLLTDEKTLPFALFFLSYEWFVEKGAIPWKKLIPFFVVSIVLILFYGSKIGIRTAQLTASSYQEVSGLMNPLIQIPVALSSYLQLFFVPIGLTLYHSELSFSWWDFAVRSSVVCLFLCIGVFALVKRRPWGLWIWWFVIGLLATLTPLKVGWIVAERYVYLSLVGLSMLVGIVFDMVLSRKRMFVSGLCVGFFVFVALCTLTVYRNTQWRTEDTLWMATARTSPSHPPTWNNMGDVYVRQGNLEKATEMFLQAIQLNPMYADAYHNLGHTYVLMGNGGAAKEALLKAVTINPSLWQSYRDLAVIAYQEGESAAAQGYVTKARSIAPNELSLEKLQRLIDTIKE